MGGAIGQVVAFAVGVAISPIPIIAIVVMLSTPNARRNGPGFLLGWIVGLGVVGGLVLALAGGSGQGRDTGSASGGVLIALGIGVLVLAAKQWRGRPARGEATELPKWMRSVDHFDFPHAAGLGFALSALNPKNLLLTLGAAAALVDEGSATGPQIEGLAVFVLIASLGPAVPVLMFFALGERARRTLDRLKGWMSAHNAAIMTVLLGLIAIKLIYDGVSAL